MTTELAPGMRLPVPLGLDAFGSRGTADQGYLIGQLLGDGSLTGSSVKWCGHLDGAREEMQRVVEGMGDRLSLWNIQESNGLHEYGVVHREKVRNATTGSVLSLMRREGLWGSKGADKYLRHMDYSREFCIRFIEGLIDSDGSIDPRKNVDISTISERLMRQVQEILQWLGIQSRVSRRKNSGGFGRNPSDLWSVHIKARDDILTLRGLITLHANNTRGIRKDQVLDQLVAVKLPKHGRRNNDGNPMVGGEIQNVAWDRIRFVDHVGARNTFRIVERPDEAVIRGGILGLRG
ncbi:LAGLIDADG family homing endonuclease [Streptomyces virginiae]|uniref:LAGLIDADG family homing endonuclease n=1 Tax=Streptomyces virginiae TaxID=1961 RepID=UPI0036517287